jgi:hypothetical protein
MEGADSSCVGRDSAATVMWSGGQRGPNGRGWLFLGR